MNKIFDKFISPNNGKFLEKKDKNLFDGELEFDINDSIPNLTYPKNLNQIDLEAKNFYEGRADAYEKYLHLTFQTYNENEEEVRSKMIDLLHLKNDFKVLEVACGTGRDSVILDKRLSDKAELHLTDISFDMIKKAKKKLEKSNSQIFYSLSNALHLPYPENYFDAFYSFGAVGEFSDKTQFFKEVVRVCKKGAKVVVGDENLPIWQKETLFGKILSNYNKQFLAEVPFKDLPIDAREVKCQWIIGGVFYLIDFRVGEGEPYANFDFEIPGARGGTHKTRYFGTLEGVKEETANLAWKASTKTGQSMHKWLDELVKKEASKILEKKK
tara:strand:+ start:5125 stop:6105 length:981 start_codon:yes stop_codon:yes gene_type:complete